MILKKLDIFSSFIPRSAVPKVGPTPAKTPIYVVRPGGLGDLVMLTRSMLALDLKLDSFVFIIEPRNEPWAKYMQLNYELYSSTKFFLSSLIGKNGGKLVINTEQYHGLASIFSRRICLKNETVFGYSTSRAHRFHDVNVERNEEVESEYLAFQRLLIRSLNLNRGVTETPVYLPHSPLGKKENEAVVALGGTFQPKKGLRLESWVKLILEALDKHEKITLLGAPVERELSEKIVAKLGAAAKKVINLVGIISFWEVVQKISNSSFLYSVDSGLVQIADFLSVPTKVGFMKDLPWKVNQWGALSSGREIFFIANGEICE